MDSTFKVLSFYTELLEMYQIKLVMIPVLQ